MEIRIQNSEIPDYARTLRVIGQDLANLLADSLEIEVVGQDFIVSGRAKAPRSPVAGTSHHGVWNKYWNKLAARPPKTDRAQTQSSLVPFRRVYTPQDIDRLDDVGVPHRRETTKTPEVDSFGDKLRAIGQIVDTKRGALVKLTNEVNGVEFQYRDERGEIHSERCSNFEIYKIQQDYYGERDPINAIDPWRGTER